MEQDADNLHAPYRQDFVSAFENRSYPPEEARTARYSKERFESYEEMLRNMDDSDPFNRDTPPPKEQDNLLRMKEKSKTTLSFGRTSTRSRLPRKHLSQKSPEQRHSRSAFEKSGNKRSFEHTRKHRSDEEILTSTYSVMKGHDNAAYDSSNAPNKFPAVQKSKKTPVVTKQGRPESAKTYLVERSDSRQQHIKTPMSPSNIELSPRQSNEVMATPRTLKKRSSTKSYSRHHLNENYVFGLIEKKAIAEFIEEEEIKQRECIYFIGKPDTNLCQCGRSEDWHKVKFLHGNYKDSLNITSQQEKWFSEKHSKTLPSNAFGTIHFQGFGQGASSCHSPYVRIENTTEPSVVWDLLYSQWHLPRPKLIISVTGGAKRFFLKPRLKNSFKRGLINAAKSTGAWIVTGGTNEGVMEFVGEAVHDHMLTTGSSDQQVVALGIATWGVINNKESLVSLEASPPYKGLFPAVYSIDQLEKSRRGISALDYNHTHFILVDDGTESKFGAEIDFRAKFEGYIAKEMTTEVSATSKQSIHIPVVQLVLEGGENTLKTALQAVKSQTPIVVIQGSGRAADFISAAYRMVKTDKEKGITVYPNSFDLQMYEKANISFDFSREKDAKVKERKLKDCVKKVREMLSDLKMVTVFHLDDIESKSEIDQDILYALLKANRSNATSQLNLALAWDRCDVARTEIFSIENRSKWKLLDLPSFMFTALLQNRADFVQLFLDSGLNLSQFLTIHRLRDLYDDVIMGENTGTIEDILRNMFQEIQNTFSFGLCCNYDIPDDAPNLLQIVGKAIDFIVGDQNTTFYQDEKYIVRNENKMSDKITLDSAKLATVDGTITLKGQCDFEDPERELFLWAILLNRPKLAHIFWKNGKDHIGGALLANAILNGLAKEANKEEELDLAAELEANSQEFEDIAVGVLNECYLRDKVISHKLLIRELKLWGETTCLQIADHSQQMEFMGHSCCQTKLNRIWKGRMALYTPTIKIIGAMFLTPLVLPTIKFHLSEESQRQQEMYYDDISNNKIDPSSNGFTLSNENGGDGHDRDRNLIRSLRGRLAPKLYKVAFFSTSDKTSLSIFTAFYWYMTAPITKFFYHTLFYFFFLVVFSLFIMTDLKPRSERESQSVLELIVWGWSFTLLAEECRQIATQDSPSLKFKLYAYFNQVWNRFDMLNHLFLVLSIILSYTLPANQFVWARMAYSATVALYFIRFLHVFYVAKHVGPKVIMISRMLTDLMFFIAIMVVFMLAYGVPTQALRYPNQETGWVLLKNIFYLPYWQMYGELFLDTLEGDVPGCSHNKTIYSKYPDVDRCPETSGLAIIYFAVYMIMTNVLLLNLLIAMFSHTFERVQENSEKVWRFYRYSLIYEYFDRPTAAPPLIILNIIYRAFTYCCRSCSGTLKRSNDFRVLLSEEDSKKCTAFERAAMENFLVRKHRLTQEHIDAKITSTGERIEIVIEDLEKIKEHVAETGSFSETGKASSTLMLTRNHIKEVQPKNNSQEDLAVLRNRVAGLEDQLSNQTDQLHEVSNMLKTLMAQNRVLQNSIQASPTTRKTVRGHQEPDIEIKDLSDTLNSTH